MHKVKEHNVDEKDRKSKCQIWKKMRKMRTHNIPDSKCVRDLDRQSEMVNFKCLLSTFEASYAAGSVAKIGLSLKPNLNIQLKVALS